MFRAISSAGWPGRMRDTPPFCTLLTYLVPSGQITRPSLPGLHRVLGPQQLASRRERQHLVVADVDDDDVALGVEGDAVRLTQRRALNEDRGGAVARDLPHLPGRRVGVRPPAPVCVA